MGVKICAFFFLPMLMLALVLYFNGVQSIAYGDTYYIFLKQLSYNLSRTDISIPTLSIKVASNLTGIAILDSLLSLGNVIINFINFLIKVLNIFVGVGKFVWVFFKTLITFGGTFTTSATAIVSFLS